ncbi:MAG: DNA cytosine methyltransferase [Candidatus Marithrix sp.]
MKILDTFAGAGGFSLGFEMAGCTITGAIEIDRWASEAFKFNNSNVICGDITKLTNEYILSTFGINKPDIILDIAKL